MWLGKVLMFSFLLACGVLFCCGGCEQALQSVGETNNLVPIAQAVIDNPTPANIAVLAEKSEALTPGQIAAATAAVSTVEALSGVVNSPAWWVAFAMTIVAAYQKRQRMLESK